MATKPGLNAATPVTPEMLAAKQAEVATLATRLVEATNDLAEMHARAALNTALYAAANNREQGRLEV